MFGIHREEEGKKDRTRSEQPPARRFDGIPRFSFPTSSGLVQLHFRPIALELETSPVNIGVRGNERGTARLVAPPPRGQPY